MSENTTNTPVQVRQESVVPAPQAVDTERIKSPFSPNEAKDVLDGILRVLKASPFGSTPTVIAAALIQEAPFGTEARAFYVKVRKLLLRLCDDGFVIRDGKRFLYNESGTREVSTKFAEQQIRDLLRRVPQSEFAAVRSAIDGTLDSSVLERPNATIPAPGAALLGRIRQKK